MLDRTNLSRNPKKNTCEGVKIQAQEKGEKMRGGEDEDRGEGRGRNAAKGNLLLDLFIFVRPLSVHVSSKIFTVSQLVSAAVFLSDL